MIPIARKNLQGHIVTLELVHPSQRFRGVWGWSGAQVFQDDSSWDAHRWSVHGQKKILWKNNTYRSTFTQLVMRPAGINVKHTFSSSSIHSRGTGVKLSASRAHRFTHQAMVQAKRDNVVSPGWILGIVGAHLLGCIYGNTPLFSHWLPGTSRSRNQQVGNH